MEIFKKLYLFLFLMAMTIAISGYQIYSQFWPQITAEKDAVDLAADLADIKDDPARQDDVEAMLGNKDYVGWLTIPGTKIDYPVMQTPNMEQYYLYRDFNGEKSKSGSLFMAKECSVLRGTNYVIFGHNMKTGTMFGGLKRYKDENWLNDHKDIYFTTAKEKEHYEVFAAIETDTVTGAWIYELAEVEVENYDQTIARLCGAALITGAVPAEPTRLIILSTCDRRENEKGRLVVVGYKK